MYLLEAIREIFNKLVDAIITIKVKDLLTILPTSITAYNVGDVYAIEDGTIHKVEFIGKTKVWKQKNIKNKTKIYVLSTNSKYQLDVDTWELYGNVIHITKQKTFDKVFDGNTLTNKVIYIHENPSDGTILNNANGHQLYENKAYILNHDVQLGDNVEIYGDGIGQTIVSRDSEVKFYSQEKYSITANTSGTTLTVPSSPIISIGAVLFGDEHFAKVIKRISETEIEVDYDFGNQTGVEFKVLTSSITLKDFTLDGRGNVNSLGGSISESIIQIDYSSNSYFTSYICNNRFQVNYSYYMFNNIYNSIIKNINNNEVFCFFNTISNSTIENLENNRIDGGYGNIGYMFTNVTNSTIENMKNNSFFASYGTPTYMFDNIVDSTINNIFNNKSHYNSGGYCYVFNNIQKTKISNVNDNTSTKDVFTDCDTIEFTGYFNNNISENGNSSVKQAIHDNIYHCIEDGEIIEVQPNVDIDIKSQNQFEYYFGNENSIGQTEAGWPIEEIKEYDITSMNYILTGDLSNGNNLTGQVEVTLEEDQNGTLDELTPGSLMFSYKTTKIECILENCNFSETDGNNRPQYWDTYQDKNGTFTDWGEVDNGDLKMLLDDGTQDSQTYFVQQSFYAVAPFYTLEYVANTDSNAVQGAIFLVVSGEKGVNATRIQVIDSDNNYTTSEYTYKYNFTIPQQYRNQNIDLQIFLNSANVNVNFQYIKLTYSFYGVKYIDEDENFKNASSLMSTADFSIENMNYKINTNSELTISLQIEQHVLNNYKVSSINSDSQFLWTRRKLKNEYKVVKVPDNLNIYISKNISEGQTSSVTNDKMIKISLNISFGENTIINGNTGFILKNSNIKLLPNFNNNIKYNSRPFWTTDNNGQIYNNNANISLFTNQHYNADLMPGNIIPIHCQNQLSSMYNIGDILFINNEIGFFTIMSIDDTNKTITVDKNLTTSQTWVPIYNVTRNQNITIKIPYIDGNGGDNIPESSYTGSNVGGAFRIYGGENINIESNIINCYEEGDGGGVYAEHLTNSNFSMISYCNSGVFLSYSNNNKVVADNCSTWGTSLSNSSYNELYAYNCHDRGNVLRNDSSYNEIYAKDCYTSGNHLGGGADLQGSHYNNIVTNNCNSANYGGGMFLGLSNNNMVTAMNCSSSRGGGVFIVGNSSSSNILIGSWYNNSSGTNSDNVYITGGATYWRVGFILNGTPQPQDTSAQTSNF